MHTRVLSSVRLCVSMCRVCVLNQITQNKINKTIELNTYKFKQTQFSYVDQVFV